MKTFMLLSALLALAVEGAWAAPLLGSTVAFEYHYPTLDSGPYANAANGLYVVGPGVEIPDVADGSASMDIHADRIVINFRYGNHYGDGGAEFNGWVLRDIYGTIDPFTSVTVDPATTLPGLAAGLSFTADTITLDWKGLSFSADDLVVLSLATGLSHDTSPVPEPGSLALVCAAMLGIATVQSRARTRALHLPSLSV